jgi:hypothetical protein
MSVAGASSMVAALAIAQWIGMQACLLIPFDEALTIYLSPRRPVPLPGYWTDCSGMAIFWSITLSRICCGCARPFFVTGGRRSAPEISPDHVVLRQQLINAAIDRQGGDSECAATRTNDPDGLEILPEPDPDRPSLWNRHDLFVNREPLRLQAFAIEREGRGQLRRAEIELHARHGRIARVRAWQHQ